VRGCLFTLVAAAIVLAVVVTVGLPAVAAGLLTAGITAAGLQADDTTVTVRSDPPTDLIGMHVDHVRVLATDATFRGLEIGRLDLTLDDVAVLSRTAGTVDGTLDDVTVPLATGDVHLDRITVAGTADHITATTTIPKAQAEALVSEGIEQQTGVRPDSVTLTSPDKVTIRAAGGLELQGRLVVTADGNLVLRGEGPLAGHDAVLVRGGEDLPIELTDVRVTQAGGLRLSGDLAIGLLG
jgi:hypothetical protein